MISNIIVELASIPNANKDLIETGNFLTKLITKAMVITGNRLSLDKMEIVNDLEGIVKESMDIIKTEEEKRKKVSFSSPSIQLYTTG